MIIYGVSANPISNYLSKRYNADLNKKRIELGLETIQEHWILDSIRFIDYGDYSMYELENISGWQLKFENEKLYCQYWSSDKPKNDIGYHSKKKTFFFKSFWLWKNKVLTEYDTYIKPISKFKYAKLMSSYDFEDEKWFNRLDTLDTEFKIYQDLKQRDSLRNLGWSFCVEDDIEIDFIGITKTESDKVLKSWNLK